MDKELKKIKTRLNNCIEELNTGATIAGDLIYYIDRYGAEHETLSSITEDISNMISTLIQAKRSLLKADEELLRAKVKEINMQYENY